MVVSWCIYTVCIFQILLIDCVALFEGCLRTFNSSNDILCFLLMNVVYAAYVLYADTQPLC